MIYCVCYDLNTPGKDYAPLIEGIKSYGTWWHHLDSTWLVKKEGTTAAAIRNQLMTLVDKNDEVLVFPVGEDWAGAGFKEEAYKWLHTNWN